MLPRIAKQTLEVIGNYRLGLAELSDLQNRKVRRLARYCYDFVPYYHSWFKKEGILPSDIRGTSDLPRFPKLTRKTIADNYPSGITVRNVGVGRRLRTSGTTSQPLEIVWSAKFCDLLVALHARRAIAQGVKPWDRVAEVYSGPAQNAVDTPYDASASRRRVAKVLFGSFDLKYPTINVKHFFLDSSNLRETVRSLLDFRPDVIYSRPSYARKLGNMMLAYGKQISPRLVICNGEFVSRAMKMDLEELYGAKVLVHYGATEMGSIGFECHEQTGLHINADCLILETVRGEDPVVPGKEGDVLITNLENEAMPLVRYQIGDSVIAEREGMCGCGSPFPRLRMVLGRTDEGLLCSDGAKIPAGSICDEFESVYGMRDFQLVQKSVSQYLIKLRPLDNKPETVERVTEYLMKTLQVEPSIEVAEWGEEDLPMKYRPVISKVG